MNRPRGNTRKSRLIIASALLILLTAAGIGGTIAYLSDRSQTVVNTFMPGNVPPEITETFDGNVKSQVRVKNNGNVDAYIRAVAVVCWKDDAGNIAPEVPVLGRDYSMEYTREGWKKHGDYYYCLEKTGPGENTPVLISRAEQLADREGYSLVVDILAQTIQADGQDPDGRRPIELAWGVDIQNGVLVTDW